MKSCAQDVKDKRLESIKSLEDMQDQTGLNI